MRLFKFRASLVYIATVNFNQTGIHNETPSERGDGTGCGGTPVTPAPGQWRQTDSWGLLASMPNLICKLQDNTNKQKLSWVSPEKSNN